MPASTPSLTVTGLVTCSDGGGELVLLSASQVDDVLHGQLPCPTCNKHCGATFKMAPVGDDGLVSSWRSVDGDHPAVGARQAEATVVLTR